MEREFSAGDVVAIAFSSAAIGGFVVAGGVGCAIQGWEAIAAQPLSAFGGAFFLAFIGMFLGLVVAGPLGLAVGLVMRRFFGSGRWVAFSSGALTAFLILVIAYLDEGFGDPWILAVGAAFITLGGVLAFAFHWHVTERAGNFPSAYG